MSFPPPELRGRVRWTFHWKVLRFLFAWHDPYRDDDWLPKHIVLGVHVVGLWHSLFRRFFFYS